MNAPQRSTPRGKDTATRDNPVPPFLKLGERYGYFTPTEVAGQGGMGSILKVQIHRDEFTPQYILSHLLSGDVSPRLVGIHGKYRLDDPDFEAEVVKRVRAVEPNSFLFQRMTDEMESREYKLVKAGYVAALKIPFQDDPAMSTRFLREVRTLYHMGDHPNIIKYISCDLMEGRPVLFTEYFPSADLAEVLFSARMPTEWALGSFIAMLKAVHHAHLRGIIHRDLKPANILTDGKDLKITDFGLAKQISPETWRTRVTMADQIVGTPAYMAPEQADPKLGPIGEETDVYQLGLTLFEMVTRRPMYDEREYAERIKKMGPEAAKGQDPRRLILDDVADLTRMHPYFPRDIVPDLPDEVEKLIMTLCQKQLLERYTCELALEHAAELLQNKVFAHADPHKPPSEEKKRDHRTTLILAASEALLAKHAYSEAAAYDRALKLIERAEAEMDVIARADLLAEGSEPLVLLPPQKFAPLHGRYENLRRGLDAERDDIDAFRPNRKIALEIARGCEDLAGLVDGDAFYEVAVADLREKAQALRTRAEQHLERIRRTGLPDKITGRYLAQLESTLLELPKLEERLAARRGTFIRRKKADLDEALEKNASDAVFLALTLKRALESGDDPESQAALEDLQKRVLPKLGPIPLQ